MKVAIFAFCDGKVVFSSYEKYGTPFFYVMRLPKGVNQNSDLHCKLDSVGLFMSQAIYSSRYLWINPKKTKVTEKPKTPLLG